MRFSLFAIASLSVALAAPVRRAVGTGVIEQLPSNDKEIQISDITGDCSSEGCQVLQEDGPHNVHDFEQHLGSQAGVITSGAAYGINGATYGNDAGVSDEVQDDGQALATQMGGYETCADGRVARPGRCRRELKDVEARGQFGDSIKPVLTDQAEAGNSVEEATTEANPSGEGPGAVANGAGRIVGGFTQEADDYLTFATGPAADYETNQRNTFIEHTLQGEDTL